MINQEDAKIDLLKKQEKLRNEATVRQSASLYNDLRTGGDALDATLY